MRRPDLVADCANCAAVCCVATSFEASEDFGCTKAAGVACPHLQTDNRCAIHARLIDRGFPGCAVYDCYGAGPRITQTFAGMQDREHERIEAFLWLRVVHELLWLLTEATKLCTPEHGELLEQLTVQIGALGALARAPATALPEVELQPHRDAARALLRRVGEAFGGRRRSRRSLVVLVEGRRRAPASPR
jgi:hypothetical protein